MLVTIDQFNEYTGNFEDSEQVVAMKTMFLQSAQEVVSEYLRFNPETKWQPEETPYVIKLTTIRIASLMLEESGGNIGISSKSFADSSRTFISYANYKKYLSPIDTYREVSF